MLLNLNLSQNLCITHKQQIFWRQNWYNLKLPPQYPKSWHHYRPQNIYMKNLVRLIYQSHVLLYLYVHQNLYLTNHKYTNWHHHWYYFGVLLQDPQDFHHYIPQKIYLKNLALLLYHYQVLYIWISIKICVENTSNISSKVYFRTILEYCHKNLKISIMKIHKISIWNTYLY